MLSGLTQQSHPRLWLLFQSILGCNKAKQRLVTRYMGSYKTILEIGCSLGTVSSVFSRMKKINYLGIDIDEQALNYARKRFSSFPHMGFSSQTIEELVTAGRKFDYVVFAGILHHVSDDEAIKLLKDSARLVNKGGTLLIMEPEILRNNEPFFVKMSYPLERGLYRRSPEHLLSLAKEARIKIGSLQSEDIFLDWLPGVAWAHFVLILVQWNSD